MGAGIAQAAATAGLQVRRRRHCLLAHPPLFTALPQHRVRNALAVVPPSQVVLVDRAAEQLERAAAGMRLSLGKLVKRGMLKDEPEAVLQRLQHATDLEVRAR